MNAPQYVWVAFFIDKVHKKVAKWLTTEPERYFYSYFWVSQMVAKSGKKKRKLNSKTVRQMRLLGT